MKKAGQTLLTPISKALAGSLASTVSPLNQSIPGGVNRSLGVLGMNLSSLFDDDTPFTPVRMYSTNSDGVERDQHDPEQAKRDDEAVKGRVKDILEKRKSQDSRIKRQRDDEEPTQDETSHVSKRQSPDPDARGR